MAIRVRLFVFELLKVSTLFQAIDLQRKHLTELRQSPELVLDLVQSLLKFLLEFQFLRRLWRVRGPRNSGLFNRLRRFSSQRRICRTGKKLRMRESILIRVTRFRGEQRFFPALKLEFDALKICLRCRRYRTIVRHIIPLVPQSIHALNQPALFVIAIGVHPLGVSSVVCLQCFCNRLTVIISKRHSINF